MTEHEADPVAPLEAAEPAVTAAAAPSAEHHAEIRRRQRSRALVMGLVLALFALLLYAITIAKIGLL